MKSYQRYQNLQYTIHSIQYIVYNIHYTVEFIQYSLYNIHYSKQSIVKKSENEKERKNGKIRGEEKCGKLKTHHLSLFYDIHTNSSSGTMML